MKRFGFLVFLFGCFAIGIDSKEPNLKENCREDILSHCNPSGKKHSLLCLLEKEASLGSACKSELGRLKEEMKTEMMSACGEDRNQFCFWVIPGGGRILKCLLEKEEELSPKCSALIAKFQK